MVFESLVVDLINRYLGDYVAKLDKSQLKLGLLGGNATVENLDIKENALDSFDLPIKVIQGHIGKITLKIPWKHLYSEPVIAELDGLYVLVVPNIGVKYNEENERLYKLEAKRKEIDRIEEVKAMTNEKKKETDPKDSFGEKLAAQIVKNLQIRITNIHIRYEDSYTSPSTPFSFGITLANLSFQTCDSSGESIVLKGESIREFFKKVNMDSLSVYWNSKPTLFKDMNRGLLKNAMKSKIYSADNKVLEFNYLIRPISCTAMMHIHMHPELTNFTVPQLTLNLALDQIGIGFTRSQYCDLTNFLDSIDRNWTQNRFRKYRPQVPLSKKTIKEWWYFPYHVILKEEVHRRRLMWSWEHIREHRRRCRTYAQLWEKKLLDQKLTSYDLQSIEKFEEEFDLLNIILCRQQAEMKAKKARKKIKQQKTNTGGWFTGWFGGSDLSTASTAEVSDELSNRVRNEFTQEEKAKLYMAIGYSENVKDPDVPTSYVSLKLDLILHKFTFVFSDDLLKEKKLMKLSIHSLSAVVQQRKSANSLKLALVMNSLQVTGSVHKDGVVPTLVSTQRNSKSENLLMVNFETNPLDKSADQQINIRAEPLEIIYDAETINRMVKFFVLPEELRLYELSSQVLASIEEVKEMTATGLKHLAEQRLYTDLKVDIKPSYFILPEHGYYKKDCKMILVDFGSINVQSKPTYIPQSGDNNTPLDYSLMKETAYDKFHISLSTIQMLFINKGDDWRRLRGEETSKNHIFRPFGFDFNLKKCVITNDVNLPKILIEGCLPKLSISISDKILHSMLKLVIHIPFPQPEVPKVPVSASDYLSEKDLDNAPLLSGGLPVDMSVNKVIRITKVDEPDSISTCSTTSEIDENDGDEFYDATDKLSPSGDRPTGVKKKKKVKKNKNLVELDAIFVLNTVSLRVYEDDISPKEILYVEVHEVGASVMIRRFDMHVKAYVGGLMVAVPQFKAPLSSAMESNYGPVCLIKTKKIRTRSPDTILTGKVSPLVAENLTSQHHKQKGSNLLALELIIAEKNAPDFWSTYSNTRHKLRCTFKSLDVCLHQEALLLVLDFLQALIPVLQPDGCFDDLSTEKIVDDKSSASRIPWSRKVGDEEMIRHEEERYKDFKHDKTTSEMLESSVVGVISGRMDVTKGKRTARLTAEREAEKKGKRLIIPELTIIQWAVSATLEKVHVTMANKDQGYIVDISLHGMKANVSINYHRTEVAISVDDFRFQDPTPNVNFKKIIWIDPGDSILTMQIVLFEEVQNEPSYNEDLNKIDMSVNLNVGKIKIIFLYLFIVKFQEFLDSFQSSLEAVRRRTIAYQDAALHQVSAVLEEPPSSRLGLNIKIQAPVIYVPEHSRSSDALMLDLGSMTFINHLEFRSVPEKESLQDEAKRLTNVVVEVSNINFTNVRMARAILMETTVSSEKGVLEPINIDIVSIRNTNFNTCKEIPLLDINGKMASICVNLSNTDYKMIITSLQNNFAEGNEYMEKAKEKQHKHVSMHLKNKTSDANTYLSSKKKLFDKEDSQISYLSMKNAPFDEAVSMKMNFVLKGLEINLFKDDDVAKDKTDSLSYKCLSKMACSDLVIDGLIFVNNAITMSTRLIDISLQDMQLEAGDDINKLIRCNEKDEDFINVTFKMDKDENSRLVLDVAGIYICVYMEFLMQLVDFFTKAQPEPRAPLKSEMVAVRGYDENPRKYRKRPLKLPAQPRTSNFEVEVHLRKPEILLVEDIRNPQSNTILVEFEIMMKYATLINCDIVNASIDQFTALFCPFRNDLRSKHSMHIIFPMNIALYCNRPINDGMQGSLNMDNLVINITPAVIQNISKILKTLQISETTDDSQSTSKFSRDTLITEDRSFWEPWVFTDSHFPFIIKGINERMNAVEIHGTDDDIERGFDVAQMLLDVEQRRADQICVRMPNIRIVLESEVTKKCIPMLVLESSIDGDIKNPLTQICIALTVSVSVSYFNDHINVWEPLIETYPDENNRQYCFELEYVTCDDTQLFSEEDQEDLTSIEPSKISIHLLSRDNLELTLSRTALDVLSKLGNAFEQAYSLSLESHKSVVGAPYIFNNLCGLDVKLYLNKEFDINQTALNSPFEISSLAKYGLSTVTLPSNKELYLYESKVERLLITEEKKAKLVSLCLEDNPKNVRDLVIYRSEVRGLRFGSNVKLPTASDATQSRSSAVMVDNTEDELRHVVATTKAFLGMKSVILGSVLKFVNQTNDVMNLYLKSKEFIHCIKPKEPFYVPIPLLKRSKGKLYIQAENLHTEVSLTPIYWMLNEKDQTGKTQIIECEAESAVTNGKKITYYYVVELTVVEVPADIGMTTFVETDISDESVRQLSTKESEIATKSVSSTKSKSDNIAKSKSDSTNKSVVPLNSDSKNNDNAMNVPSNINTPSTIRTFLLEIRVPIVLRNQLPVSITYQSQMVTNSIKPGSFYNIRSACLERNSIIKISYEYELKDWYGCIELKNKMDEWNIILFRAREGFTEHTMNLGLHLIYKEGSISLTIYSPYWMINKTGYTLTYKADDYVVQHPATNSDAVLFSFLSKSLFKTKPDKLTIDNVYAYIRIEDSNWSDKFSLDTVGSSGKITLKKKPYIYEVAVKISLSSSGLTRIVSFMPYYMIINRSNITLYCTEVSEKSLWITVPPNEAVPFWPCSEVGKSMLMRCKVEDNEVIVTQPFPFYESHSVLLKLDKKYVGVFVEVQITEEANLITLQLYQDGMALVQIINHLGDDIDICYKQHGTNYEYTLAAYNAVMYAWQDARQKRELIWRIDGDKKTHTNPLTSDGIEDFYIDEMKAYWISFVWDMQRILLFTNDIYIAKTARLTSELEKIDMEFVLSLQSIGLSLVDNFQLQEISYVSITSSGVRWNQVRRKNRYKELKLAQSEALEVAYDEYISKIRTTNEVIEMDQYLVNVEGMEVDISKKLMLKPDKCELIRVFEPGVFLQYRTSPHQLHLHLRIHRIQVDNQMYDCHFPVVFAPFPPPRSISLDTGLKPLIELSAVIGKTSHIGSLRFKYFRILIQEMQVMLDQGYVNAILDFLAAAVPDQNEEEMFEKDTQLIKEKLIDTETIKAILMGGKKCVFDNFHISPIKLHLSFSLSKINRGGKTALHSEILNLFLQSVGIAITDMQDVIFKLGYFEKQNSIMPMNQMTHSIMRHYISQGLRQMYVLVLGLDVIGNPFGVIRGMAQGVEDLFYEPVRGAILGPEEFVEGVAYGVKSLFGHAVGGAAGAVSRIVGTMGKGIAALTLDADYQRRRREQLARKPENFGVGLAQGGKGLVTGIFSGVTGIITKPIDGAKKEGVEGFFKGVGKGLVGVVTRPVSGVVDFASSSFEGIRRVADTTEEVFRIRPPRYIALDGIIRNYRLHEAEGINIWLKILQKNHTLPNESYLFHIYCKSKKNVLLLTNLRVLHLEKNDIIGAWIFQWSALIEKLEDVPVLNESKNTIVFTFKEKQRRFFNKDTVTKEIEANIGSIKRFIVTWMSLKAGETNLIN